MWDHGALGVILLINSVTAPTMHVPRTRPQLGRLDGDEEEKNQLSENESSAMW